MSLNKNCKAGGLTGKLLLAAALAVGFTQVASAQALAPSAEFGLSSLTAESALMLAQPNLAKISLEDSKAVGGAYRYGVQVATDAISLIDGHNRGGQWQTLRDGRMVWRAQISSPGARSLDFAFSKFVIPQGAALYVVSADGKTVRGPYNADNQPSSNQLWTAYVPGETATLELIVPRRQMRDVQLELGSVTHGYRGLFEGASAAKSGSCNVDTACPAGTGWENQIDSVGHYTFGQGGSSYVCTGTLVGNTANTSTPYFLTANHCISSAAVASSVVVYWNYQSATCRTPGSSASGSPLSKSIATHSQSGAALVATNSASDFTLLQLSSVPAAGAGVFYAGWDRNNIAPSSAVGIHHPSGHEKRIAVENQALSISSYSGNAGSGSTHLRVADWDQGTTEGGSSGSALFNGSKRIVGQLHGGSAACGNNEPDWYGRLSVSWAGGGSNASRLSTWLDSANTGAATFDGYRTPGGGGTPPPSSSVLSNGVPVSGLGAATGSELNYTIVVPSGASNLNIVTSGGTGDSDLYVRFGTAPTTSVYDCRPYLGGNAETCTFAAPQAGTYHIKLRAYSAFSGVTLSGSYSSGGGGGGTVPSFFENQADYTISDNSTVESPITVSGRSGNAPSTLRVAVTIIHTYQGDLKVDLVAPDGSLYNIHNRSGGGTDNVIKTVTVNASSEVANGVWKLRVNDNANGDVGRIDQWSLQF
jgi:hypothetical protein